MTDSDESVGASARALAEGDLNTATELSRLVPVHDLIGLRIVARDDEHSLTATMELSDAVRGAAEGTIHGGILATFADVVSATAVTGAYDERSAIPVTTDCTFATTGSRTLVRSPPRHASCIAAVVCSVQSARSLTPNNGYWLDRRLPT